MAFVVETGFGIVGATSYATVAQFRAYLIDRGRAGVTSSLPTDAAVQSQLIRATDYVERRWSGQFNGSRRFTSLLNVASLTMTAVPLADATVTIGARVFRFDDPIVIQPDGAVTVDPGASIIDAIANLRTAIDAIGAASASDVSPDGLSLAVYTGSPVSVATDAVGAAWDRSTTSGASPLGQPLSWPRVNAYFADGSAARGVPPLIRDATIEYAYRAGFEDLIPDAAPNSQNGVVRSITEQVGPIRTSTEFFGAGPTIRTYPAVDSMLTGSGLVAPRGGGVIVN